MLIIAGSPASDAVKTSKFIKWIQTIIVNNLSLTPRMTVAGPASIPGPFRFDSCHRCEWPPLLNLTKPAQERYSLIFTASAPHETAAGDVPHLFLGLNKSWILERRKTNRWNALELSSYINSQFRSYQSNISLRWGMLIKHDSQHGTIELGMSWEDVMKRWIEKYLCTLQSITV